MVDGMPPAEVEVSPSQVASLLADQWPDWDRQNVSPLAFGWDNLLFRVGDGHLARLPRRRLAVPLVENEARWLPTLATSLPLPVPAPILLGAPGHGYPWPWLLVPWIEGRSAGTTGDLDYGACARQAGGFLRALHVVAPDDAPSNPVRGVPLDERDEAVRSRIAGLAGVVDPGWCTHMWERALSAPAHHGKPVWIHGDLHPHNLLVSGGELSGVVDFGDIASGDPATDLAVMWGLLPEPFHGPFRMAYGHADPALWERARGWALALGLAYLGASADNPVMAAVGRMTLERLGPGPLSSPG